MWRKFRIAVLLIVLATVAESAWLRTRDLRWNDNFYVAVYPINADGSANSAAYINTLSPEQFAPIAEYFSEEAARYGLPLNRPFEIVLGPQLVDSPPVAPKSASMLDVVLWSLQLRWWSWGHSPQVSMPPKVWLYLLYHDPAKTSVLAHSTALNKGRIGVVNVFANAAYEHTNQVVIAHELLHTVGATDKYDAATNLPQFPVGFADAEKSPLYPQDFAELMAGRIPTTESHAEIPSSLSVTLIGEQTAREIRWIVNN
jgi:hypothetical protein